MTVPVIMDPELEGFCGLHVVRVRLFLSFTFENKVFPCALVEWYVPVGDEPDEVTGMWAIVSSMRMVSGPAKLST